MGFCFREDHSVRLGFFIDGLISNSLFHLMREGLRFDVYCEMFGEMRFK